MKKQLTSILFLSLLTLCLVSFSAAPYASAQSAIKCGDDEHITDNLSPVDITASSVANAIDRYEGRIVRIAIQNGYSCDASNCDLDTDFCVLQFDGWSRDDFTPTPTDNGDGTYTFPTITINYDIACSNCKDTISKVIIGEPIEFPIDPFTNDPQEGTTGWNKSQLLQDIYPNPAFSSLNIELQTEKGAKDIQFKVFDAQGQQVMSRQEGSIAYRNYLTELDISALSPGVYVLQIIADNTIQESIKFIVKK